MSNPDVSQGAERSTSAGEAQSTGSAGVAAEPVAYRLPEGVADRIVSVPHPHWTGQWVVGWLFSDREEGRDTVRSLAMLAAEPTPPAGGGETEQPSDAGSGYPTRNDAARAGRAFFAEGNGTLGVEGSDFHVRQIDGRWHFEAGRDPASN